jgi:hypothetical protein
VPVEDLIAVRVSLESGEDRYFVTWGRIQDAVDPDPVAQLVLEFSTSCSLGGRPVSAEVCQTLQEARDAPYFFEALFEFAQRPIPFGEHYDAWRSAKDALMRNGKEIYYLGR